MLQNPADDSVEDASDKEVRKRSFNNVFLEGGDLYIVIF